MVHRSIHGGRGDEGNKGQARPAPRVLEGEQAFDATFLQRPHGGGTLEIVYRGPLAQRRPLWVRFGERRGGEPWVDARDVPMSFEQGRAVAAIPLGPEPGLEGACLVFFSRKDGAADSELVWDNAGHELGYYELDFTTGRIHRR
ncbi:MAG TPA: hypothetical protein VGK67_30945 [Myxococcales bacterium]|jgi:hypothetical protein